MFLLIVDGLYVETPTVSPSPSFPCFPSTGVLLSGGNLGTESDGKKARRRRRMMAEGAWVGRRRLERGKGLKSGAGARGWVYGPIATTVVERSVLASLPVGAHVAKMEEEG